MSGRRSWEVRISARSPLRSEEELRKLATHRVRRKKPQTTRAPSRVTKPVHAPAPVHVPAPMHVPVQVKARPSKPVFSRLPDRFSTLSHDALQLLWNARIQGFARCPACDHPEDIALGLAVSSTPCLYRFACGQCGWLSQWFRVFPSNRVAETSFDVAAGG